MATALIDFINKYKEELNFPKYDFMRYYKEKLDAYLVTENKGEALQRFLSSVKY
jgi:hypothetical protein